MNHEKINYICDKLLWGATADPLVRECGENAVLLNPTEGGYDLVLFAALAKAEVAKMGWFIIPYCGGTGRASCWAKHYESGFETACFTYDPKNEVSEAIAVIDCVSIAVERMPNPERSPAPGPKPPKPNAAPSGRPV